MCQVVFKLTKFRQDCQTSHLSWRKFELPQSTDLPEQPDNRPLPSCQRKGKVTLSNRVTKVRTECPNDDIGYYKHSGKCNKNS